MEPVGAQYCIRIHGTLPSTGHSSDHNAYSASWKSRTVDFLSELSKAAPRFENCLPIIKIIHGRIRRNLHALKPFGKLRWLVFLFWTLRARTCRRAHPGCAATRRRRACLEADRPVGSVAPAPRAPRVCCHLLTSCGGGSE